jgi:hypothetical protein
MPAGSLPPAHWAGMPGRQGVEKIHPAINFTLHSKVRVPVGLPFLLPLELFSVFRDAETANPLSFLSGFSIHRVAFGYLPNPRPHLRRCHLKFPLRLLLLKRHLPPRWKWRCPRLGEPFFLLHSTRARRFHVHALALAHTTRRTDSRLPPFFEKGKPRKRNEKKMKERSVLGPLFWFVEMIR